MLELAYELGGTFEVASVHALVVSLSSLTSRELISEFDLCSNAWLIAAAASTLSFSLWSVLPNPNSILSALETSGVRIEGRTA